MDDSSGTAPKYCICLGIWCLAVISDILKLGGNQIILAHQKYVVKFKCHHVRQRRHISLPPHSEEHEDSTPNEDNQALVPQMDVVPENDLWMFWVRRLV